MAAKTTVALHLRSGQTVRFKAERVTVTKSAVDNSIRELRWEGADKPPLYVRLSEIVAVVEE